MKKTIFGIILIAMFIIGCAGNPAPTTTSSGMTLDQAIKEAAGQIDRRFEANSKIALVNFNSTSDQFSAYVLDELTANLVDSRHLEVIDRQEIELRRGELNLQMSGEVSDDSMQALGRTLGAQNIVSGSLTSIGNTYRIVIRALNVESGRVEVQYRQDIANDSRVTALLGGGRSGGTATAGGGTTQTSGTAQDTGPTYKIGDTGPAGGIIFYDKGNRTGGWRYLEAAPEDIERKLEAVPEEIDFSNLKERAVGWGKRNTAEIMKIAAQKGGGFGWPAQACDAYELNGFNDWFLPSQDEVRQMYGNLHMRGLGNFRNDWYLSSTWYSTWYVEATNFSDGKQDTVSGFEYVRPVRQF